MLDSGITFRVEIFNGPGNDGDFSIDDTPRDWRQVLLSVVLGLWYVYLITTS